MIKHLKNLGKDDFVRGSLILFIMINIFNVLNYVFHFSMARLLGPAEYGVLAVLMSIGYIFGISSDALQNIFSRYTSKYNLKKEYGKMKNLVKKGFKKGIKIGIPLFLLYLVVAIFLSFILKIDFGLLALTGVLIFSDLLAPISRGVLQGTKRFIKLGSNMIVEGAIKVILSIILVYYGLMVYGAIAAVILSIVAGIVVALYFLKDVLHSKEELCEFKNIKSYGISYFTAIICVTLMFSLDVIIARIFFSPEVVGLYAVASTLGKMIFFATSSIGKSMFPYTSEGFDAGQKTRKVLYKASIFLLLICIIAVFAFAFFPELIVKILFGTEYLAISGLLVIMGLSMSTLAFTNLIVNYAFSKDKCSFAYYLPIFVVIEIIVLCLFSSSLVSYALAFLFSNIIMFIGALFLISLEKSKK